MVQKHLFEVGDTRPFPLGERSDNLPQRLDTGSLRPYTLSFGEGPGYLCAKVCAETVSLEAASEYMLAIAKECRSRGLNQLLIERDVPVAMPMAHLVFIVDSLCTVLSGIKVAFINPYREIDERLQFLALAAKNRGTDLSVHSTFDAARDWLVN